MNSESIPVNDQPAKSHSGPIILTFCAISALLVFMVYSRNFIFGSVAGKWTYPYYKEVNFMPLWIPVIVIILLGLAIFIGSKLIHSYEKATLLGLFFIAVFIQLLIQKVYPFSLADIIRSDDTTTFYSQARLFTPFEILSRYTSLVDTLLGHLETNMPGKILLFQFFEFFTTSPSRIGYLIVALSTLGAPLLYGICKNLFHDRLTGFYAFILYALIPSKQFFLPILNTVTPVFILLCFYLFLVYIERKKTFSLWLLGAALYILVLFEPSPLVTGILFLGVLIFYIVQKKLIKKEILRIVIIPVVAFIVTYLFFSLVFSFDLLQALAYVLKQIGDFNLYVRPAYSIWLGENLKEFSYVIGLPIMMIFLYQIAQIFSEWTSVRSIIRNWSIEKAFILSLLVTFSTSLFLGIIRGEITRLWIYMAVFFQVPASFFMGRIVKSNLLFFIVASTLVVQSIITLHRVAFLIP